MSKHDISGEKFGSYTVLKKIHNHEKEVRRKSTFWLCKCDCGTERVVARCDLKSGSVKSCGCSRFGKRGKYTKRKIKNKPISKTRFYRIWVGMRGRCYDSKNLEYKNYGAKGIKVCDEWLTFENFKNDMYEAYLNFEETNGEKSATIDRIDFNGDYEVSNCRWQTQLQQARNRSNNIEVIVDGATFSTISQLAEAYGLNYHTVLQRYNKGKSGLELVSNHNLKNPDSEMIRGTNGLYNK